MLTSKDTIDSTEAQTKRSSYLSNGQAIGSQGEYLRDQVSYVTPGIVSQFPLNRWLRSAVSSLVSHVFHVVLMRSQEQVVWSEAAGIVTLMTDEHALWNETIVDLPAQTMGVTGLVMDIDLSVTQSANTASRSRPDPTIVRTFDSVERKQVLHSRVRDRLQLQSLHDVNSSSSEIATQRMY